MVLRSGWTRLYTIFFCFAQCVYSFAAYGGSREWSDSSGAVKIKGTLLAADDSEVVIKLDKKEKGRELLAVAIIDLSDADREYLKSQEAASELTIDGEQHVWELKNGLKVFAIF